MRLLREREKFQKLFYNMTGATMFDWWSLQMNAISSVDHPGLDLVTLLVMDDIRHHLGHRCCTASPLEQRQPC
jgi:hypothetical protein